MDLHTPTITHDELGNTYRFHPIAIFAAEGNLDRVQACLTSAISEEEPGLKDIALQYAAENGHEKLVKSLLNHGAQLYARGNRAGQLHSRKAQIEPWTTAPLTALHLAVENGQYGTAKILLRSRRVVPFLAIYPRKGYWMTVIHHAAAKGDEGMVRLLLDHGVPPDYPFQCLDCEEKGGKRDRWSSRRDSPCACLDKSLGGYTIGQRTAVDLAAEHGHLDIVQLLLFRDRGKRRELSLPSPVAAAAKKGYTEIVRVLLDYGFDVNDSPEEATPLKLAAERDHDETAHLLLERGGRFVDRENQPFDHLLPGPTWDGNVKLVKMILKYETDAISDEDLMEALERATDESRAEIADALMNHAKNRKDKTALDITEPLCLASRKGNVHMVQNILDLWTIKSEKPEKMRRATFCAGRSGSNETLQALLAWEPSPENFPSYLSLCLLGAISANHINLVEKLLDQGVDLHRPLTENDIKSLHKEFTGDIAPPLHIAAQYGSREICHILLGRGMDVNEISYGRMPLHHAAESKDPGTTQLLIDNGAALGAQDYRGETPLHVAARRGACDVIKVLLDNGADIEGGTENPAKTPIGRAAAHEEESALGLLAASGAKYVDEARKDLENVRAR